MEKTRVYGRVRQGCFGVKHGHPGLAAVGIDREDSAPKSDEILKFVSDLKYAKQCFDVTNA